MIINSRPMKHLYFSLLFFTGGVLLMPSTSGGQAAVTIAQLLASPERYSGKNVTFEGILVRKLDLYTLADPPATSLARPRRYQFTLSDMSGAQILVIMWVSPRDQSWWSTGGGTGTPFSVHGIFHNIPMVDGPPLQLVVPVKGGLTRK